MTKTLPVLFAYLALFVVAFLIGHSCKKRPSSVPRLKTTDTVYVEKIVPFEVDRLVYPDKVWIQKQVDSALRAQKENSTIVLGQKLSRQKNASYLNIQTIDTVGQIREMQYELLQGDLYTMDSYGNIEIDEANRKKIIRKEKRKKIWRKVKTVAVFTGGVVVGVFTMKTINNL